MPRSAVFGGTDLRLQYLLVSERPLQGRTHLHPRSFFLRRLQSTMNHRRPPTTAAPTAPNVIANAGLPDAEVGAGVGVEGGANGEVGVGAGIAEVVGAGAGAVVTTGDEVAAGTGG